MAIKPKMGKPKIFETPEELWEYFLAYKKHIQENPIKLVKYVGKDQTKLVEIKYEPPTWKGFEIFLFELGLGQRDGQVCLTLDRYRRNVDGGYENYIGIIRAIGAYMFSRKFTGAAIGEYQHNIIARELGMADIQETHNFERPILEGGRSLPEDDE